MALKCRRRLLFPSQMLCRPRGCSQFGPHANLRLIIARFDHTLINGESALWSLANASTQMIGNV